MKAYIIGFEGKHRNPKLADQLRVCGFDVVETNGAVDATQIDVRDQVDIPMFEAVVGRYPLKTEVGCAQAHLNAWKFLIEQNLKELAVFEDDAVLTNFDVDEAKGMLSKAKGPWYVSMERRKGDFLISHLFLKGKLTLRRSIVQPRGNAAYIISREAAILGVKNFERTAVFDGIADVWPGPSRMFRFFVFLPPPFKVDPSATSIIGVERSRQFTRLEMAYKVLKILISRNWTLDKKNGLLRLKVLRPLKYLGSVHFLTAWYIIRFGRQKKSFPQ